MPLHLGPARNALSDLASWNPEGTQGRGDAGHCSVNKEDPDSRVADLRVTDLAFMRLALDEAIRARELDEVPIGAVIVFEGEVVGRGHNQTRTRCDPTAHAELLAVREAAGYVGAQRLVGATVYATLEPCFMCAGALSHARVQRVVWATRDPKFGGCASLGNVLSDTRLNHQVEITEGVLRDESRDLLQSFFRSKRGGSTAR